MEKLKVRRRPRVAEAALHLTTPARLTIHPFAHQRAKLPRYNLQPRISAYLVALLEARSRKNSPEAPGP
ncbi:MAG: hypothetical protein ACO1SV_08520 [Fimbriimonas sp.]